MNTEKKYYAFISYKHEDEEWAKWLQYKLEHYKLPSNLNGRTDLPKEIRPIFKDTLELNPGNLPQQIHDALEQSKFLIVICSPRSARSEWVNKEVNIFIGMGKKEQIIPFIIDGKAFAKNAEKECFPQAIRNLPAEQEIIGSNISEIGRDAAAVKVVAQMFGLKFDELWQRYEREKRKKRSLIVAASIIGFLIMTVVAFLMNAQQQETLKANWKMMENQSRFVAEKANTLVESNSYLAQMLAIEALPKDLDNPQRPFTPEAEALLREAICNNTATLKGHWASVNSTDFSPNGEHIISSSSDMTIKIWDAFSGKLLQSLEGHNSSVNCAIFSPDGKQIVSVSNDKTIRIWNADSGLETRKMEGHTKEIQTVAFSPNGTRIVSASKDGSVRIWDIDSGTEIKKLEGHTKAVRTASYSPDGNYIISSSDDCTIMIWDSKSGLKLKRIDCDGLIGSVVFSPNGKEIVSGSYSGTIRIFDAESGLELRTLNGHHGFIHSISFNPEGSQIVTTCEDCTIRIWDYESGIEVKQLKDESSLIAFKCAFFSPDGTRIVSSASDCTVRIWDIEQKIPYKRIADFSSKSIVFSPNGKLFCSVSNNNNNATITFWDSKTGFNLGEIKTKAVSYLAFSPDGRKIVSVSSDYIKTWDVKTRTELLSMEDPVGTVNFVAFSPNGEQIISATYHEAIRIWDSDTGHLIQSIDVNSYNVKSAVFSPDGNTIFSICCPLDFSSNDIVIKTWNAKTGLEIKTVLLKGRTWGINCFLFSPNCQTIVTGSNDGNIRLWNTESGLLRKELKPTTNDINNTTFSRPYSFFGVNCITFNINGTHIVSGSNDGIVRVWNVDSGIELKKMAGHSDRVISVAISPDDRSIVSASIGRIDRTIRFWEFPPLQELIDQTRERFKDRPLTDEERRMYYLE